MPKFPLAPARVFLLLVALVAPLSSPRAETPPPTLLYFHYSQVENNYAIPVPARAGTAPSPLAGKLLNKLVVAPGDGLTLAAQPGDILVELYRGTGVGGELQCTIHVRYYPGKDGKYFPHYRLYHEPSVFRGPNGRWIPVEPVCNSPSTVKLSSSAAANSDGFYPALEFALVQGPLQIDSWVVK